MKDLVDSFPQDRHEEVIKIVESVFRGLSAERDARMVAQVEAGQHRDPQHSSGPIVASSTIGRSGGYASVETEYPSAELADKIIEASLE